MISKRIWIVVNIRFFVSNCLAAMDINAVCWDTHGISWDITGIFMNVDLIDQVCYGQSCIIGLWV